MGYRSDVTCIMYTQNPKDKGAGTVLNMWLKQNINDADMQYFEFHDTEVLFIAEDWKWYESYPDIQRLEKLFMDFKAAFCGEENPYDCNYAYEFIRVGESYDDIETDEAGASMGRISLSRSIRIEGIDD